MKFQVVCPQNGTAVLTGLTRRVVHEGDFVVIGTSKAAKYSGLIDTNTFHASSRWIDVFPLSLVDGTVGVTAGHFQTDNGIPIIGSPSTSRQRLWLVLLLLRCHAPSIRMNDSSTPVKVPLIVLVAHTNIS